MNKPIRCTTHFHACDCREYEFEQLRKEIQEKDRFILSQEKDRQRTEAFWKEKLEEKDAEIERLKRELELAKKQEYHPLTNPWRIKCGNLASDLQFVLGVALRDGYVPFADLVRFEEIKHRFNLSETPNSSKEGVNCSYCSGNHLNFDCPTMANE